MLDRLNWRGEKKRDYNRRIKLLTQIHRPKTKAKKPNKLIPQSVIDKHTDLTEKDIILIRKMILSSYSRRLRDARILDITIPHLGRIKTHGNRVKNYMSAARKADKKNKRKLQKEKELTKNYLLF